METKINWSIATTTWTTFLTQIEHTSKCNVFKSFPQEEVIQATAWKTSIETYGDQRLLIEAPRANQMELSHQPTCYEILIN